MLRKLSYTVASILATIVGLYVFLYAFENLKPPFPSTKPPELLTGKAWTIGFYTHIFSGGIALLVGWLQFHTKLRVKKPVVHRNIGKIYLFTALFSALSGIYIGFFANGGVIPAVGFICLGIAWFTSTIVGYQKIRAFDIERHQIWMTYSYAACFAAVTLRIWLPLLMIIFQDFLIAYSIVAWLCWVPNLLVARLIVKRIPKLTNPLRQQSV